MKKVILDADPGIDDAVAYVSHPEFFTTTHYFVDVDINSGINYGSTPVDLRGLWLLRELKLLAKFFSLLLHRADFYYQVGCFYV